MNKTAPELMFLVIIYQRIIEITVDLLKLLPSLNLRVQFFDNELISIFFFLIYFTGPE